MLAQQRFLGKGVIDIQKYTKYYGFYAKVKKKPHKCL